MKMCNIGVLKYVETDPCDLTSRAQLSSIPIFRNSDWNTEGVHLSFEIDPSETGQTWLLPAELQVRILALERNSINVRGPSIHRLVEIWSNTVTIQNICIVSRRFATSELLYPDISRTRKISVDHCRFASRTRGFAQICNNFTRSK